MRTDSPPETTIQDPAKASKVGPAQMQPPPEQSETRRSQMRPAQWAGLVSGGAVFLGMLFLPAPPGFSIDAWRTAAVAVLMAVWWMTEAIPIAATALIPLVLFPVLGVLGMSDAAAPYANEVIFLFLGGFLIAFAMERWQLHRRAALAIVDAAGTGPRQLILGFMVATAFLSMWISNTAATAMMLPIGLALSEMFKPPEQEGSFQFGIALMLGTAYAANIGGSATLIGTPPNAIMAAAASEMLGIEIGFVDWMLIGIPFSTVMLLLAWLLLVGVLHRPGKLSGDVRGLLGAERKMLGPPSRGEQIVAVVFALTALAWILREPKTLNTMTVPGILSFAPNVTDGTIAIAGALALFLLPVDRRRGIFVLDWETARRIPWEVLILFGGGLSLARAMERSGLAEWIGSGVSALGILPAVAVIAAAAALFVFLTEITSNTATATMAMPIMAGAAAGLGLGPVTLMATAALSSAMAFMLPVATPPNAIVFGSGYFTIPQMARAGLWLNLIAIVVITLIGAFLMPLLFIPM